MMLKKVLDFVDVCFIDILSSGENNYDENKINQLTHAFTTAIHRLDSIPDVNVNSCI